MFEILLTIVHSQCLTSRMTVVPKEFGMTNCVFHGFYFEESGGILCLSNVESEIEMVSCLFYLCTAYYSGGAIYISNTIGGNNSIKLRNICASTCFTIKSYIDSEFGSFALVKMKNCPLLEWSYVSILKCSPHTSGVHSSTMIQKCNATISSLNCSNNKCYAGASMSIFDCIGTNVIYCTFSENKVVYGHNFYFASPSGNRIIQYCNVVGNNGISYGVMSHQGNSQFMIYKCIFYKNTEILFCNLWASSYGGSGVLTISNCFISHSGTTYSSWPGAPFTNINNAFSLYPTYAYSYFMSFHCNADIPLSFFGITNNILLHESFYYVMMSMLLL